ncbi:hypothetical protein RRG08_048549 [Elysia crispata]|uniref:Uncharacterized protein n=1 Tax=Elysia crispata TaxID=231223 RepID=A0AAE1B6N1_9GAST|nr:hypothetical protein RRG08_048549 [Elysia crispata]
MKDSALLVHAAYPCGCESVFQPSLIPKPCRSDGYRTQQVNSIPQTRVHCWSLQDKSGMKGRNRRSPPGCFQSTHGHHPMKYSRQHAQKRGLLCLGENKEEQHEKMAAQTTRGREKAI